MPERTAGEAARHYADLYEAALARWPVTVERLDVPTRLGTTRVNACGPADGPSVVLMPGGGASSVVYVNNVAALSRAHRVYAVDSPASAGLSVYHRTKVTATDIIDWLDDLLDGLKIRRTTLVGHSLNGWTCANYALRHPDRVSHLVLLDPTGCFARTTLAYVWHGIPVFLRRPDAVRRFIAWETDGRPIDPALEVMCATRPGPDPFVWPKSLKADAFRDFEVRTTVVAAMRTKMVDPATLIRNVGKRIPHATVVEIPDATHMTIPVGHPDQISRAILGIEKAQA